MICNDYAYENSWINNKKILKDSRTIYYLFFNYKKLEKVIY